MPQGHPHRQSSVRCTCSDAGGWEFLVWCACAVLCCPLHAERGALLCSLAGYSSDTCSLGSGVSSPHQSRPSHLSFDAFRWSTQLGSRRIAIGHPRTGEPHYGVVSCSTVRYRVPMIPSILDELGAADPLFRLNTDMYRFGSS